MQERLTAGGRVWFNRALRFIEVSLDALFYTGGGWYSRLVGGLWVAALFLFGVSLWGFFFSWGNISFDFLDWAEVTGPRYALLHDAVMKGQLPLHAGNLTALRGVTDRYFSIADTPFSPQILLLRYLETGEYLFFDTVLFYGIGFIGLLLLARRYRLSPVVFTIIALLFSFNGSVTAHFAVGHSIWTGHFLIPYFILLVLDLLEREQVGWAWHLGLSVVMLLILMQGYFHLYVWCLMFLGLLALFNWRLIRPVLIGGLFSVLTALPRLLPPSLALSGITQEYLGGFASVTDMIDGMITLRDPLRAVGRITDTFPLNAWETDYYIGLLGFAFVVIFGILLPLLRDRSRLTVHMQVLVACLIFAAFSVGEVFAQVVRVFTVPPLTGERATARMFIVPLSFCIVLAGIFLQRELVRRRTVGRPVQAWLQILFLGAVGVLFHDINQHIQAWRVRYLDPMVDIFPKMPFDAAQHTISNHPDAVYFTMLVGGGAVALLALAFLVLMSIRQNRRPTTLS